MTGAGNKLESGLKVGLFRYSGAVCYRGQVDHLLYNLNKNYQDIRIICSGAYVAYYKYKSANCEHLVLISTAYLQLQVLKS
jgi:hypothetical protein